MIIAEINDKSKQAKKLVEMLKTFPFVEIKKGKKTSKDQYTKMIKDSYNSKNRTKVNPQNVWESM